MDMTRLVLSLLVMLSTQLAGSMAGGEVTSSVSQNGHSELQLNMCLVDSGMGDAAALSFIGRGGQDSKRCGCTLVAPPNTTLQLEFAKPIYDKHYDEPLKACLWEKKIQKVNSTVGRLKVVSECMLEINIPDPTATFKIFQRLFLSCQDRVLIHDIFSETYTEINLGSNQQSLMNYYTTENSTEYIHINYSREGAGSACLIISLQATRKLKLYCGPGNSSVEAAFYKAPVTKPPILALYNRKTLAAGEVWAILGGITIFFLFCVVVLAALYIMREHKEHRKKKILAGEGTEIESGLDDENLKALRSNAKGCIPDQALMEKTEIYETLRLYDIQAIRKQLRGELNGESKDDDDIVKKTRAFFKKKRKQGKKTTDFSAYKDTSLGTIYDTGRNPIGGRMQQSGITPVTRVPKDRAKRLSAIEEDEDQEGIDPGKASFRYQPRYLSISGDIHASGASLGQGWETTDDSSTSASSLRWTDVLPIPEDQRSINSLDSLDEKRWRFKKAKKKDGDFFFGTDDRMNVASVETLSKKPDPDESEFESEDPYNTLNGSIQKLDNVLGRYVDEDPYNTLKPNNLEQPPIFGLTTSITATKIPPYPHCYDNPAMEKEEEPPGQSEDNLHKADSDDNDIYHSLDFQQGVNSKIMGFEDTILENPSVKFNTLDRKDYMNAEL